MGRKPKEDQVKQLINIGKEKGLVLCSHKVNTYIVIYIPRYVYWFNSADRPSRKDCRQG